MAARTFDRKFGEQLSDLPSTPGVYLFSDGDGRVIYVGKANDLRRRLRSYRNASRRRQHRKMRRLVRAATTLEVELLPSEEAALLRENELIRTLRPEYNVEGAYAFLYPAIGLGRRERQVLLCFTTQIDAWQGLKLDWFGSYRSRQRARDAFRALVDLLGLVAHRERRTALPPHPLIRGSRLVGLRQLAPDLFDALGETLAGESDRAWRLLTHQLLDKPRALREPAEVQQRLDTLVDFHEHEAVGLRNALRSCGQGARFVPQSERDALFIRARHAG